MHRPAPQKHPAIILPILFPFGKTAGWEERAMQKPCRSPVIRNTHLGIYMDEGEIDCVKPLRFGNYLLAATAKLLNTNILSLLPQNFPGR